MTIKVIIKEQKKYELNQVTDAIKAIFRELGVCEKLKNKKIILLKPNLLGAHHPDKAVTTHPIVVEAVIKVLKDMDKEIIVGDSPGGTAKAASVWKATGMQEVCDRHGIRLIDFGKEGVINVHTHVAKFFFDKNIMECDAIINLAKMKTHSLMLYTGAVKNLYGAIPGLYKSELHRDFPDPKDFALILSSIYGIIKPNIILNLIDGIVGMDGEGPSAGNPYPFGVLLASEKATAVDYVATKMMGFDFDRIYYLKQSLAEDDLREKDIKVKVKTYPDVNTKTVIFRSNLLEKMPGFVKKIFKNTFSFYPDFKKKCKMCMICVQSCPVQAIENRDDKLFLKKKKCIKCMCCHEMCPVSAIYLRRSLLARLVF